MSGPEFLTTHVAAAAGARKTILTAHTLPALILPFSSASVIMLYPILRWHR